MTVGGLTIFSRAFDALMHLYVAYLFGTSDALDAFIIAYLIPFFTVNVISGAFHAAIIPTYIQVREDSGPQAAQHLYSNMMVISIWLIGLLIIAMAIISRYVIPVIGSGFDEQKLALTRSLFITLLPVLLFNGVGRIWISILNADERFKLAATVPAVRSVTTIIFLFLLTPFWGIYAFSSGIMIGSMAEAIVLSLGVKKQKLAIIPRWYGMNRNITTVIKQFLPVAAGAMLMASTDFVDQSMAAMLGAGSVSTLNYANKIIMFILVVSSGSLGTVVFPYFSKMTAAKDYRSVIRTLKLYSGFIIIFSIPMTVLFWVFSEPLVRILFERGVFTTSDTHRVAVVLAVYALQITFYLLGILIVRLLSAMRENNILMYSTLLSVPLNIFLNYILMKFMGISGIALSTVLVYLTAFLFLSYSLHRKMREVIV